MEFLDLPEEMLEYVASFLPAKSLSILGQTCRQLREIAKIDSLWHVLCNQDYQVNTNRGWKISYRDIYTKVLQTYGFLGLKRLARLPYGGLVNVCWGEGEIQVLGYRPQRTGPREKLQCRQLFSIRWNETLEDLDIICVQNEEGPKPATFIMSGKYPLLQCTDEDCQSNHTIKETRQCYSDPRFKNGFEDHPGAFRGLDLTKGFNCPMLPMQMPTAAMQMESPVKLGLYAGDYGSHGIEIINLTIKRHSHLILEGLKITGDPNVPAGNASTTVFLDKPLMLTEDEQSSIYDMLVADGERIDEEFEAILSSNNNKPDMRQPFVVPYDCSDRGQVPPKTCIARYVAVGRIAGHFYQYPSECRSHMIVFSDTTFALLWLELSSLSIFRKVENDFPVVVSSSCSNKSQSTPVDNEDC